MVDPLLFSWSVSCLQYHGINPPSVVSHHHPCRFATCVSRPTRRRTEHHAICAISSRARRTGARGPNNGEISSKRKTRARCQKNTRWISPSRLIQRSAQARAVVISGERRALHHSSLRASRRSPPCAMSRPASAAFRRNTEEANVKVVVRCRCVLSW